MDEGDTGMNAPGVETVAGDSLTLNSSSDSLPDVSVTTKQMSALYARSLSMDSGTAMLSRREKPAEPETPFLSTAVTASKMVFFWTQACTLLHFLSYWITGSFFLSAS